MKHRRRSWMDRKRARLSAVIAWSLQGSARPLPMHRHAALWLACRMLEVDLALWRLRHGGQVE